MALLPAVALAKEKRGSLGAEQLGIEHLADIHIEVDPQLSVAEGHRIGHVVKDRLLGRFENLRDVLVHLEPYPHSRHAGQAG